MIRQRRFEPPHHTRSKHSGRNHEHPVHHAQHPVLEVDPERHVEVQPHGGGYQPLMRAYIGQGLRADLERLADSPIDRLLEALRHQGVPDDTITRAMGELSLSG